jgi:hypothetical protein
MMRAMSFGERSSRLSTGTLPVPIYDRSSSRPAAVAAMSRVAAAGQAGGDSGLEAVPVLKRRLSGVVYAALRRPRRQAATGTYERFSSCRLTEELAAVPRRGFT